MASLLLFGILSFFIISYACIDRDLLSPINAFLLFSTVAIAAMFLFYNKWDVGEYSIASVAVFLSGSLAFVMGCFFAKRLATRNLLHRTTEVTHNMNRIEVSYGKTFFIIGICVLALYGTYAFLGKLVGGISISTVSSAINQYRDMNIQGQLIGETSKSSGWRLFSYMSTAFAHCCIFIFINNAVNKNIKKKDVLLIIPFILRAIEYLLQANRGGIIYMVYGALMSWFISVKFVKGWKKRVNKKVVKIIVIIAAIFIPLFFLSLLFMGRYNTLKGFDFKNSALIYLSGGIRNFDQYIKAPTGAAVTFGEETFVNLHRNLFVRQGIGSNVVRYLEFRTINGENIGNIYTAFRRFYHDFGFVGVCILPFFQGTIISLLYYNINRGLGNNKIGFIEVLYCYLAYTTIYLVIDDTFFSSWVSISGAKQLIILFCAYYFVFNIKSKRRGIISFDFGRFIISRQISVRSRSKQG